MTRCPACGKGDDCRCEHWCEMCGIITNHTTAMHAQVLVDDAAGGDDCPA